MIRDALGFYETYKMVIPRIKRTSVNTTKEHRSRTSLEIVEPQTVCITLDQPCVRHRERKIWISLSTSCANIRLRIIVPNAHDSGPDGCICG